MALLFMDSCDHYATADFTEKWTVLATDGAGSPTFTVGAFGGNGTNGLRIVGTSLNGRYYFGITPGASGNTFVLGFRFKASTAPTLAGAIAQVQDGATSHISLFLNTDMTLTVKRNTTTLGTTTFALSSGVFAYIELKVLIDDTTGTVDLNVNGVNRLSLTGQDTRNGGAAAVWTIAYFGVNIQLSGNGAANYTADFDDFYVMDGTGSAPWNGMLGDVRVAYCAPTANGANTGWTTSTGSDHAALVDETAPNDDTDYVQTSTTGVKDTFVMADLPVTGVAVYGVQIVMAHRKVDPASSLLAAVTRHSGVDYDSASQAQGTTYAYNRYLQTVNPGTSVQWNETDFNAAQFGMKKIA